MLFSSLHFILFFFPLFLLVYFTARKRRTRNVILLIFSLIFYAWGEPLYIFLMLFSLTFNYFSAILIDSHRDKAKKLLVFNVTVNLLLLGVFKYTGFVAETLNLILGVNLTVPSIALPIGISFYSFQIMSYVIDVYRGDTALQRDYIYLGAYLSAFPQLIAGPIVRYSTVAEELENRRETLDDFAAGIRRFIMGLSKKVLIANVMAETADLILASSAEDYGIVGAWIAVLAYTLQIYFDFSGYSDKAIGMGRMMGFHYLENFNYPYAAVSVTDFWRRWHISLSSFFRDYVYIPLGGNRVSKPRWIFNLSVVWILTGLWHGASWNFVLWGVYFGVLLILEKLFWGKTIEKIPLVRHIYTILVFVFGWVIFCAETLTQAGEIFKAMFGCYGLGGESVRLPILLQSSGFDIIFILMFTVGCILSAPVYPKLIQNKLTQSRVLSVSYDIILILLLIACTAQVAVGSYNPFIYFRF